MTDKTFAWYGEAYRAARAKLAQGGSTNKTYEQ